jgi:hypothetical protein
MVDYASDLPKGTSNRGRAVASVSVAALAVTGLVPIPNGDHSFCAPRPRMRNADEALTTNSRRKFGSLREQCIPRRESASKVLAFHGQRSSGLYLHSVAPEVEGSGCPERQTCPHCTVQALPFGGKGGEGGRGLAFHRKDTAPQRLQFARVLYFGPHESASAVLQRCFSDRDAFVDGG